MVPDQGIVLGIVVGMAPDIVEGFVLGIAVKLALGIDLDTEVGNFLVAAGVGLNTVDSTESYLRRSIVVGIWMSFEFEYCEGY